MSNDSSAQSPREGAMLQDFVEDTLVRHQARAKGRATLPDGAYLKTHAVEERHDLFSWALIDDVSCASHQQNASN